MIVIANDGYHAHYFERLGWVNSLTDADVPCGFYNIQETPAFDVFEMCKPTVFIGQLYNMDEATIKCLLANPDTKVILRAGHFSKYTPIMNDPHMLTVSNEEIKVLKRLVAGMNNKIVIYCHYLQDDVEYTHELFKEFGVDILGVPMAADIITYRGGDKREGLECDIGFVGGYWPYKGQIIDQYLTPLLYTQQYSAKIFGNQPWPHISQYCGMLDDVFVKDLFVSAKVCPNLSEPHAHTYGFDLNERAFKILAAGGVCVMDNVLAARALFGDHVLFATNPDEFKEKIDFVINTDMTQHVIDAKKFVYNNHTSFHRVASMLEAVNEKTFAKEVMNAHNNYI